MSDAWKTALTVLQEAQPDIPPGAHVMTVVIEFPPGDPGTPPHRHPGPAFGYVIEGEMLFELEGQPPRVIRAGEAFWEPGGDVVHYSDGNNRTDIASKFTVTMMCVPGRPMLELVDPHELEQRRDRRWGGPARTKRHHPPRAGGGRFPLSASAKQWPLIESGVRASGDECFRKAAASFVREAPWGALAYFEHASRMQPVKPRDGCIANCYRLLIRELQAWPKSLPDSGGQ